MAKKASTAKTSNRSRQQDRARVAGAQHYEVGYQSRKSGKPRKAVKKAVKRVGNSRKKVERALSGRKKTSRR